MRTDYLGLEAFVAIAELGSFNRAADYLHLSQAALSHRIRKIEADLGVQLLIRSTRDVLLTKEGQALLPQVRRNLALLSEAYDGLRKRSHSKQDRLAIACLPTIANYYLPAILRQFSEECPDIAVQLHDQPMGRIYELVQAGEAIFLGGLALLNLSPGPNMVRHQLPITYTIVWSLALATIIGAAICILLSNQIAKITKIRFTIMAPWLFMMIAFAAFESRQSQGDLIALIAIGFLGIVLRRFDYSRPAFLIGFVLSGQVENFTNMANQIANARFNISLQAGLSYIATPLSLGILALTVASIFVGLRHAKHITENEATASGSKRASVIFLLCITAYVAASLINASTITLVSDKIFPLTVAASYHRFCGAPIRRATEGPLS